MNLKFWRDDGESVKTTREFKEEYTGSRVHVVRGLSNTLSIAAEAHTPEQTLKLFRAIKKEMRKEV